MTQFFPNLPIIVCMVNTREEKTIMGREVDWDTTEFIFYLKLTKFEINLKAEKASFTSVNMQLGESLL